MQNLPRPARVVVTWAALGGLFAAPFVVASAGLYVGATAAACAAVVLHYASR